MVPPIRTSRRASQVSNALAALLMEAHNNSRDQARGMVLKKPALTVDTFGRMTGYTWSANRVRSEVRELIKEFTPQQIAFMTQEHHRGVAVVDTMVNRKQFDGTGDCTLYPKKTRREIDAKMRDLFRDYPVISSNRRSQGQGFQSESSPSRRPTPASNTVYESLSSSEEDSDVTSSPTESNVTSSADSDGEEYLRNEGSRSGEQPGQSEQSVRLLPSSLPGASVNAGSSASGNWSSSCCATAPGKEEQERRVCEAPPSAASIAHAVAVNGGLSDSEILEMCERLIFESGIFTGKPRGDAPATAECFGETGIPGGDESNGISTDSLSLDRLMELFLAETQTAPEFWDGPSVPDLSTFYF